MTLYHALIAIVGGILPALIWLWFWMQEDKVNPEPGTRIAKVFILGMLTVPLALGIQFYIARHLFGVQNIQSLHTLAPTISTAIIITLAFSEELLKYGAARIGALRGRDDDEPIDSVIYLIVAGLGFSAMENALYFIAPLINNDIGSFLVQSNFRFLGATLVHVASCAVVGMAVGFTTFRFKLMRIQALILGLIAATALHSAYNFLIMTNVVQFRMIAFILIWSVCVSLIILFEKIKQVHLNPITSTYEEA